MSPRIDPWYSGAVGLDVVAASWASPAALRARQSHRLQALLAHAAARSPFYARRLHGLDPASAKLADIEPVAKAELMHDFADWVTDPRLSLDELRRFAADPARIGETCLDDYVMWTSSGSSGEPGIFVQDAHAMAVYDALEALRRPPLRRLGHWLLHAWSGERFAFVGATEGHFASTVSVERLRRLVPGLATAMRGFSFLLPIADLVAQLQDFAPTALATYPTIALMLAEESRAGRLRIAPEEIGTGGETLTPAVRRCVEDSFGCRVGNSYGASEFLALGAECRCGQMHVNDDWVILESVDEHLVPVPDGEPGHTTLLTNLANHVQPLIRYDLGDRITLHREPCACGSALPRLDVQGRTDDLLTLRDARRHAVRLAPLALTTVLEEDGGVFDFQLEQTGDAALLLRIAEGGEAGHIALGRARDALAHWLGSQGLPKVELATACAAPIGRGASGKVQRVVGPRHRNSDAPAGMAVRRRHRVQEPNFSLPTATG